MLTRGPGRFVFALAGLTLAAVLAFAACGGDEEEAGTQTPEGGETPVAGAAPELEDGTLTIGSDIAYAPMEFFIEGTETPDGVDVDIAKAIARELGVEVEFINTGFDGIIQALNTEDFDIIMSAMTITDERSQQIDFVPYLNVGVGILVEAGNPKGIQTLEDMCGLTVAVQLGTIQQEQLDALNADACADNKVNIVTFDTNPLAVEDLRTGGSDANFSDLPVALLDAQQSSGALELVEPPPNPQPYGIGLRKGSTALKAAIEDAFQAIRDSGEYEQILTKWEIEFTALP